MPWAVTTSPTTEDLLAVLDTHVHGESEHIEAYRRLSHTIGPLASATTSP